MPFVANTPESLLGRSDSKDPNSTCRGITSNGRPCRRSIPKPSPPPHSSLRPPGRPSQQLDLADEGLYCWQHKEQASRSAQSSPGPRARVHPILEERSSIDTLADRLGLIDVSPTVKEKRNARPKPTTAASGRPISKPQGPPKMSRPKPKQRLSFCFCFSVPLDEVPEPARPRPRPLPRPLQQQQHAPSAAVPIFAKPQRASSSPDKSSSASQTAQFKTLIPDSLDSVTASALMAELSRPYADAEEPGYIYMFWLTPTSKTDAATPPVAAARSLLAPPSPPGRSSPAGRVSPASRPKGRRPSDVVSQFADTGEGGKMLLKIGRAANVQRRMNQWQRQCGHDIEMLRYYPYLPGASDYSSPSSSPSAAGGQMPRTTPHCRRIERLIHIELSGMGLRANLSTCEACGRDHREWFEVETSRAAVGRVDEVIRRWVNWDETTV